VQKRLYMIADDLRVYRFFTQIYWGAIGYGCPAAIGAGTFLPRVLTLSSRPNDVSLRIRLCAERKTWRQRENSTHHWRWWLDADNTRDCGCNGGRNETYHVSV